MYKTGIKHFFTLVVLFVASRIFTVYFFPSSAVSGVTNLIPIYVVLPVSFFNSLILYKLSDRLFPGTSPLLASVLYIISPWVFYYENLRSVYLLYLTVFLLGFVLSSFSKIFRYFPALLMAFITLSFIRRDFFSSEIGLINSVNVFRGEAQQEGFETISKIVENRYVYYLLALVVKTLAVLDPVVYFTPQAKIFPFFNTPPFWIGFLPLFLVGFWQVIEKRKRILFLLIGIVPGIFYVETYGFEKLIFLLPFFLSLIILGYKTLSISNNRVSKIILFGCLLITGIQILIYIPDYLFREGLRFQFLK